MRGSWLLTGSAAAAGPGSCISACIPGVGGSRGSRISQLRSGPTVCRLGGPRHDSGGPQASPCTSVTCAGGTTVTLQRRFGVIAWHTGACRTPIHLFRPRKGGVGGTGQDEASRCPHTPPAPLPRETPLNSPGLAWGRARLCPAPACPQPPASTLQPQVLGGWSENPPLSPAPTTEVGPDPKWPGVSWEGGDRAPPVGHSVLPPPPPPP